MAEKQKEKMLNTPIWKLIPALAVPSVISMLISSVYNMVDTYFAAKLGTKQAAAVGVVYPFMTLIQAVGFTLGMGAGSLISRLLGEGKREEAQDTASVAMMLSVLVGTLISTAGILFLTQILTISGGGADTMEAAKQYAKYIVYSAPAICLSYVLSTVLRAEGKTWLSMLGITVGGLLNLLLDLLFIFGLGMGIAGASVATALSQIVGAIVLCAMFLRRNAVIRLKIRRLQGAWKYGVAVITNGMPSLFRQGSASLSSALLNNSAAVFSQTVLAAMSVVGKITMVAFSVMIGIAQGYQPAVGFGYGANDEERVRKEFFFTLVSGTGLFLLLGVGLYLCAPFLASEFLKERGAAAIASSALRYQAFALPFIPLGVLGNITFQALGKKWRANMTSCFRQGIFYVPLILLLPRFLGVSGIALTQALADVLTCLGTIPFLVVFFRRK